MTPLFDKLPPQNIEAEQGVLGSILIDNEPLDEIIGFLKADDFYRDTHQIAYRAIQGLYGASGVIDAITLAEELTRRGQYDRLGGNEFLATIVNSVPHVLNAVYYANIVRDKSVVRQAIEDANQTLQDAYSNNFTAEQILARASERLLRIEAGESSRGETIAELLPGVVNRFADRGLGKSYGVRTGFVEFDRLTDGIQPGEFAILAARPSMGKTALALNIADNVAIKDGLPVLFVSLEMSNSLLTERILIGRSGVESHRARSGAITPDGWARIHEANDEIAPSPVHFVKRRGRLISDVVADVRRMKNKHGIALTIIDYIQLIDGGNDRASEMETVTRISKSLKGLADGLNMPILALSQLNRQSENREDRRPRMADLRSSGSLEQDADLIALLFRPEYYDPNDDPGLAELDLAKNRNGPTGMFKLTFEKPLMRFTSYSDADIRVTYGANNAPF